MATVTPRVTIAQPPRKAPSAGVLPMTATSTKAPGGKDANNGGVRGVGRISGPRLKIQIRRLPPGLSQVELGRTLGGEWGLDSGRVDWMEYKPGKVSTDPTKSSRPSRVYMHLLDQKYLGALADKARKALIQDTRNTSGRNSDVGPLSVEFAPYARVPTSQPRIDSRQGTIDQDPDFIAFLESLTNPVMSKTTMADAATGNGSEPHEKTTEKPTVTPLVQYLKDKKANKHKETSSPAKSSRSGRPETKDGHGERSSAAKGVRNIAGEQRKVDKGGKPEKGPRETIRVLRKDLATATVKTAVSPQAALTPVDGRASRRPERRREVRSNSAVARMLQRDLGLGGNAVGRRGNSKKENDSTKARDSPLISSESNKASVPAGTRTASSVTPSQKGKSDNAEVPGGGRKGTNNAPTILKKIADVTRISAGPKSSTSRAAPSQTNTMPASSSYAALSSPKDLPTGISAFLKHANPSQGVTEPLLRAAMEVFGTVTKVEIDKKKGFAYVDFRDPEDLQKAIRGSPVRVGEGEVVILERKNRANGGATSGALPARGQKADRGRGGGGGSGGRGRGRAGAT